MDFYYCLPVENGDFQNRYLRPSETAPKKVAPSLARRSPPTYDPSPPFLNPWVLEESMTDSDLERDDIPRSIIAASENIITRSDAPAATYISEHEFRETSYKRYSHAFNDFSCLEVELLMLVSCCVLNPGVLKGFETYHSGCLTNYTITSERLRCWFKCWLLAAQDLGVVDYDGLRSSSSVVGQEEALRRLKQYWVEIIVQLQKEVLADVDKRMRHMYLERSEDVHFAVWRRGELYDLLSNDEAIPPMPTDIPVPAVEEYGFRDTV